MIMTLMMISLILMSLSLMGAFVSFLKVFPTKTLDDYALNIFIPYIVWKKYETEEVPLWSVYILFILIYRNE